MKYTYTILGLLQAFGNQIIGYELSDNPKIINLDTYTVVSTATRTERLAINVPVRTEILSPDLFFSANTPNLAAALEYLPGARVEANCQNCGTAEVKLLGLGSGYNRLLFDGQPLFSGLAAVYGLEHIPTAFVERIEVVKGGSSSLYGAGAVAGVINIIPHEPIENKTDFSVSYESYSGKPSLSYVGLQDWIAADSSIAGTVYGEYRENEAVDLNEDGFSEITQKDFYTIGTQFWVYPIKNGRISTNYSYTWEERRGGDHLDWLPHETQITEQLEHHWHRGGVFWEHDPSHLFFYKIGVSLSNINRNSYYGGVGEVLLPEQPDYDASVYNSAVNDATLLYGFTESKRLYLDSLFVHQLEYHSISWGAQYQRDKVFDEKRNEHNQSLKTDGTVASHRGENPIANDSFDNTGIFLQDEWDPNADWTFITGLRVDKHSQLDDWVLSPRAAIRYTVNSEFILRGSISTGFRAPEIFDEDFHIEILDDPIRTQNSTNLSEEKSTSWSAGLVWTPAFADNRLQTDLEFYRTEIVDTFYVSNDIHKDEYGNAYKIRENAGGSIVQGFEINFLYRFTPSLSIEAGVNYNDPCFNEAKEVITGVFEKRYVENPKWSGVAQFNYSNEDLFDVFVGLIYTGPMIAVNEVAQFLNYDTGNFFVLDLSFSKHIPLGDTEDAPHIDLTAGVRNLFDQRQDDLSSGPGRDPGYFYGPRFPRSYFISVRTHF